MAQFSGYDFATFVGVVFQKLQNYGENLRMGEVILEDILDKSNGLYQLANRLNGEYLIEELGFFYAEGPGRPEIPIRVMVGLHYLKYLENESDESVVEKFCENPYWQYFCGMETFQHHLPCHPTTLVKWRKRIGEKGLEKLLSHTIDTAKRMGLLPEKLFKNVKVDTTVQEKAITFPTDTKLCHRMRIKVIAAAKKRGIDLRQTYVRVGRRACIMQARYAHAHQMKRARKELKKVRSYLGKEHHPEQTKIYISGKKNLPLPLKKLLKGRSGIEPIIGHLKHDHRLNRNYLLGKIGDKINAILAGCGFNLRKILNCINDRQVCFC